MVGWLGLSDFQKKPNILGIWDLRGGLFGKDAVGLSRMVLNGPREAYHWGAGAEGVQAGTGMERGIAWAWQQQDDGQN